MLSEALHIRLEALPPVDAKADHATVADFETVGDSSLVQVLFHGRPQLGDVVLTAPAPAGDNLAESICRAQGLRTPGRKHAHLVTTLLDASAQRVKMFQAYSKKAYETFAQGQPCRTRLQQASVRILRGSRGKTQCAYHLEAEPLYACRHD